jgi:hypothetical protein
LGQSTRNTARTKTDTNRLTSDGDPLLVVTATLNTTETSTTPAAHGNSITGSAHSETSTHTVTTLVQTDQNQSLTVAINETTDETRVTTSEGTSHYWKEDTDLFSGNIRELGEPIVGTNGLDRKLAKC